MSLFMALNPERILAAAIAVGASEYCLRLACDYARERKVFRDVPIGAHQAIQHPLAEVKIRQEAVYEKGLRGGRRPWSRVSPGEFLDVTVMLASEGTGELVLWDASEGLPREGEALLAARPASAVPAHDGDLTIVSRAIRLGDR